MSIWDAPITELFGCQPGYPLNQNLCPPGQGFHNGIDYGAPVGTDITVNGVVIGISGATGEVTGPHCHVGHWNGGTVIPISPQDGKSVNGAKVTQVSEDSVNGKFVRVGDADGTSWVYLHMSDNTKVSVGQALQGEDMEVFQDSNDVRVNGFNLYGVEINPATQGDALLAWVGKSKLEFFKELGPQVVNNTNVLNKQIAALQAQVGTPTQLKPGLYKV